MTGPVHGRLDGELRLIEAEPRLAALQRSAGGDIGGALAVPQVAALARLARRLGITISRPAVAAEGEADLDLWVRAQPSGEGVALEVSGWSERRPRAPDSGSEAERDFDFLRAAADWVWESDARLCFTSLSPAAVAATGRAAHELIGRQLTRLFRLIENEDGGLPIVTALAEKRPFEGQLAELREARGGRYRLDAVRLIDGRGRFAGFRGSATLVDAPEAGPAQAAAPERSAAPAQRLAEVPPEGPAGAFGRRLDEALRVPLARIIANAETIGAKAEGPLRADYTGYAGDIAAAGRHLLSLVDDLVDLQAIERPGFRPEAEEIDLADVARRAAGLLAVRAADRGVRIDAPSASDTLLATGEFKRALQVVMNLLTNAIRHSPEGGQLWIRTDREGDLGALIVCDQGRGIAPEDQDRIFEKFERLDPGDGAGTGLGLYIARRLARVMGGDLAVDSAPGQGARFTFTLPLR